MRSPRLALFLVLLTNPVKDASAFATPATPSSAAAPNEQQSRTIGVRFSLYPNVGKENPPSLKSAVKAAVVGLSDLGLSIRPDDVSSCLVGKEGHVIEALQSCFARASVTTDGTARGLSMQGTLSYGYENFSTNEIPARTAAVEDGREFVPYAYLQPPRIAAQFALYPRMDSSTTGESYETTIDTILKPVRASPCWKDGPDRRLCYMLDGDGNQVFEVLRETFALACAKTSGVAMTMTLTANKSAWPESDRSQPKSIAS
jgi:hypothetical protein